MNRLKIIFLILCCCSQIRTTAQNWDSLNSGINYWSIYSMYADSADNYLYFCGAFLNAGGVPVAGLARWDGTTFSSMGSADATTYPHTIIRYQDSLYVSGGFYLPEDYVSKWNGTSWDTIGHVYNGAVLNFVEYSNELYAMGVFDSIENVSANNIAKWNGSSWSSLKDTIFNASIFAMAVYNNDIYIGGTFYNFSTGVSKIAKWNGTNYVPLSGGGIYGGMDDIVDMVVYDNELYVSGTFTKASGNVGNYIQKWDGTSWSEVGGGVMGLSGGNGQIHDMKIYGNDLYVVGVFETAGGIPAQYVAKWDGTNWCGFGSSFDNRITAIEFKNGEMYIGGGFSTIDGDTIYGVAKWIGGSFIDTCGHINTGINNLSIENEINLYPNPASNQINLEFELSETKNVSIEIKNVLGQTIKTIPNNTFIKGKNKIEIDISEFSNGLYFVQIKNDTQIFSKKVIKQK